MEHNKYSNIAIPNNCVAWKHGHVVAAVLSRAQLWINVKSMTDVWPGLQKNQVVLAQVENLQEWPHCIPASSAIIRFYADNLKARFLLHNKPGLQIRIQTRIRPFLAGSRAGRSEPDSDLNPTL